MIKTVQRQENKSGELIGYFVNSKTTVPLNPEHRLYLEVLKWIEAGNVPEPVDVIIPPDTTEHDAALARLKEMAKTDSGIADILILLGK